MSEQRQIPLFPGVPYETPAPKTEREEALLVQVEVCRLIDEIGEAVANLHECEASQLVLLRPDEKRAVHNWLSVLRNAVEVAEEALHYLRGCLDDEA